MPSHSFDYLGYKVRVFLDRVGDGVVSGRAELFAADGAPPCRIFLSSPQISAESALVELASRARSFIDGNFSRSGSRQDQDPDLKGGFGSTAFLPTAAMS